MYAQNPIDFGNPINRECGLCRGLLNFWMTHSGNAHPFYLYDLTGRRNAAQTAGTPTLGAATFGRGLCRYQHGFDSGGGATIKTSQAVFTGQGAEQSIGGWYRFTGTIAFATNILFSSYDASNGDGMVLDMDAAASPKWRFRKYISYGNGSIASDAAVSDTNWHFLTGTVDSSGAMKFYIDAIPQSGSATKAGSVNDNPASQIGGSTSGRPGELGDVITWNRWLSPAEVMQVYQESVQGYPNMLRRFTPSAWWFGGAAAGGGGSSESQFANSFPGGALHYSGSRSHYFPGGSLSF